MRANSIEAANLNRGCVRERFWVGKRVYNANLTYKIERLSVILNLNGLVRFFPENVEYVHRFKLPTIASTT